MSEIQYQSEKNLRGDLIFHYTVKFTPKTGDGPAAPSRSDAATSWQAPLPRVREPRRCGRWRLQAEPGLRGQPVQPAPRPGAGAGCPAV